MGNQHHATAWKPLEPRHECDSSQHSGRLQFSFRLNRHDVLLGKSSHDRPSLTSPSRGEINSRKPPEYSDAFEVVGEKDYLSFDFFHQWEWRLWISTLESANPDALTFDRHDKHLLRFHFWLHVDATMYQSLLIILQTDDVMLTLEVESDFEDIHGERCLIEVASLDPKQKKRVTNMYFQTRSSYEEVG